MSDEMMGAINAHARVVVDYDPDPHNPGAQVLSDILLRLHGWLVPATLGGDVDPGNQFHGYGPAMQTFQGMANAGTTNVTNRDGGNAELSSAIAAGPSGDPARRIFADRLRRRSPM